MMLTARRRWLAGALLVGAGWLVTPQPVPVYDGIGTPDEPYRFVAAPPGATQTAVPTTAFAQTPVKKGRGTNGLSVTTTEVGPQFSLFLPPMAMATTGESIAVKAEPTAPTTQPQGAKIDGNVYALTLTSTAPITLTEKAALATLYLRATSAKQPPPAIIFRSEQAQPWKALKTSRGGQDFYVTAFPGPGEFAVAFADVAAKDDDTFPVLPVVLGGVLVLLVAVVLVVRLRSAPE